jgi:hypothetical protein
MREQISEEEEEGEEVRKTKKANGIGSSKKKRKKKKVNMEVLDKEVANTLIKIKTPPTSPLKLKDKYSTQQRRR